MGAGNLQKEIDDLFKSIFVMMLGLVAVVGMFFGVSLIMGAGLGWITDGRLKVSIGVVLFSDIAFLSATIAYFLTRKRTAAVYAITNLTVLLAVLCTFAFWILHDVDAMSWFVAIATLLVVAHSFTFIGSLIRRHTMTRLVETERSFWDRQYVMDGFEKQFHSNSATYFAAPVGAIVGVLFGAVFNYSPHEIVRATLVCISSLILVVLCYFILDSARRLCRSYCMEPDSGEWIRSSRDDGANSMSSSGTRTQTVEIRRPAASKLKQPRVVVSGRHVVVETPPLVPAHPELEKFVCDSAVLGTDVRKLFLFNQYQQLAAALISAGALLYLLRGDLKPRWIIAGFLILVLVTGQIPYAIGQQRERIKLLSGVRGVQHADLKHRLDEVAPLYPKLESYLTLTASGTIGAIAGKLLEKALDAAVFPSGK